MEIREIHVEKVKKRAQIRKIKGNPRKKKTIPSPALFHMAWDPKEYFSTMDETIVEKFQETAV